MRQSYNKSGNTTHLSFQYYVLVLIMLYISPLCVYLQSLWFISTNMQAAIYIFLVILLSIAGERNKFQMHGLYVFWGVFMIFISFAALLSGGLLYFMQTSLLFVFLFFRRDTSAAINTCLWIIVAIGFLCAVACIIELFDYAFYRSFILPMFNTDNLGQIARLYESKGTCGIMPQTSHAAGCILNAFYIISTTHKYQYRTYLLILLFFGLVLTGKRAHLFFGMIVWLWSMIIGFTGSKKTQRYLKIVILVMILLLAFVIAQPFLSQENTIIKTYNTIVNFDINSDDTMHGREFLYTKAIDMIKEAPLMGHGWGSFRTLIEYRGGSTDTHNVYLQLFAEMGVFVLAFFIVTAFAMLKRTNTLLKRCRKKYSNRNYVELLSLSFCFQAFFLFYSFTGNCLYNIDFFAIYTLGICLTMRIDRELHLIKIT